MSTVKAYAMTDIGLCRTTNQDSIYVSTSPIGFFPNLFVVADGMGGYNAGDFASKYAIDTFTHLLKEKENGTEISILNECVCDMNIKLREKSKEDASLQGMGTTFALATIVNDTLYAVNVGDSRIYVINDTIKQISKDHSYVEELVSNGSVIRGSKEYWKQKNIITRAIGAEDNVEPDFFEINLSKSDKILLCSDGLTNMVNDNEIYEIINSNSSIQEAVEQLISLANEHGGKDNIAIILVEKE